MKIGTRILLFLLATFFWAPAAVAQATDYNKFGLSFGVFFSERETDTTVDTSLGAPGTNVDLEDDLGLDKSTSVFRLDGFYRFAPKHQINFSAFDLSRSASVQIQKEFVWDGTLYEIDTVVNSDFDLQIYKLDYTWRFLQREKWYLGLTGGLYVADFDIRLESNNVNPPDNDGLTAPLPVIGLRGEYSFSERWTFRADAEIFAFEYDDYDGSLYDLYAGVDYDFTEHFGMGIGINTLKMDIGVTKTSFAGNLDWQYTGALLFLKVEF